MVGGSVGVGVAVGAQPTRVSANFRSKYFRFIFSFLMWVIIFIQASVGLS